MQWRTAPLPTAWNRTHTCSQFWQTTHMSVIHQAKNHSRHIFCVEAFTQLVCQTPCRVLLPVFSKLQTNSLLMFHPTRKHSCHRSWVEAITQLSSRKLATLSCNLFKTSNEPVILLLMFHPTRKHWCHCSRVEAITQLRSRKLATLSCNLFKTSNKEPFIQQLLQGTFHLLQFIAQRLVPFTSHCLKFSNAACKS